MFNLLLFFGKRWHIDVILFHILLPCKTTGNIPLCYNIYQGLNVKFDLITYAQERKVVFYWTVGLPLARLLSMGDLVQLVYVASPPPSSFVVVS